MNHAWNGDCRLQVYFSDARDIWVEGNTMMLDGLFPPLKETRYFLPRTRYGYMSTFHFRHCHASGCAWICHLFHCFYGTGIESAAWVGGGGSGYDAVWCTEAFSSIETSVISATIGTIGECIPHWFERTASLSPCLRFSRIARMFQNGLFG